MPVLRFDRQPYETLRAGVCRKKIFLNDLMTVVIDFSNGPWSEPEPPHAHPHEQISYVAEGELLFFCDGEPSVHLKPGDCFSVPSGRPHTVQLLTERVRLVDSFTPIRADFLTEPVP